MFRSFDAYGGYNIENPMVIDSLLGRNIDFDKDEKIVFNVDIVIDTRKLDAEQENHLVNAIEDANYSRGKLSVDCADENLLSDDADGVKWNAIKITGYADDGALENIYNLIDGYNVKDCVEEI